MGCSLAGRLWHSSCIGMVSCSDFSLDITSIDELRVYYSRIAGRKARKKTPFNGIHVSLLVHSIRLHGHWSAAQVISSPQTKQYQRNCASGIGLILMTRHDLFFSKCQSCLSIENFATHQYASSSAIMNKVHPSLQGDPSLLPQSLCCVPQRFRRSLVMRDA